MIMHSLAPLGTPTSFKRTVENELLLYLYQHTCDELLIYTRFYLPFTPHPPVVVFIPILLFLSIPTENTFDI